MTPLSRADFLRRLGTGALGLSFGNFASGSEAAIEPGSFQAIALPRSAQRGLAEVKPIEGSWMSIWWDDHRHFYWNDTCLNFTALQWDLAVKEAAEIGMRYLVLLAIAKSGKAFFRTRLVPDWKPLVKTRSRPCWPPPTSIT